MSHLRPQGEAMKTIEQRIYERSWITIEITGDQRVINSGAALAVAKEYAEERASPLRGALVLCHKTLGRYCPDEGSPYAQCLEVIEAVLAAEEESR